ncbi:MAG: succinyl-diaminopimelate desuccinylase [Alphaproteobacteria bacterium]|nr:MAG: succinyl-diaminopimelate desuccinylase [Alphaproteobacteria bacterium]
MRVERPFPPSAGADDPRTQADVDPGDPIALTRALVRCPSVTPREAGALDLIERAARALGFRCWRLAFDSPGTARVDNLFARRDLGPSDRRGPHFCFAGHSDVVPVGRPDDWRCDPFSAMIENDLLIGRGTADMKGAIAAMLAAMAEFLTGPGNAPETAGTLSLLITGDEEGPAINGTRRVLEWMAEEGHLPDFCLVGEPTNPARLGEMIKIGRRGSLNGHLIVEGTAGHVAYPHLADNPVPKLLRLLDELRKMSLDEGTAMFQPSNLEITHIEVGNPAHNVIPARAEALFNIRFNDLHDGERLARDLHERLAATGIAHRLDIHVTGEAFLTPPGPPVRALVDAIRAHTGEEPELSTSGGTSDARFIKDYCPVVEFGLVGATMHKANEAVAIDDIVRLKAIYGDFLGRFFASTGVQDADSA